MPTVDSEFCNAQDGVTCTEPIEFCSVTNPNLKTGTTMQLLPDSRNAPTDFLYKEGTSVAFFILPDGNGDRMISGDGFGGEELENVIDILFSVPTLNDPTLETESDRVRKKNSISIAWFPHNFIHVDNGRP